MDISLIGKSLEASENPGMDTLDPRFADISGLATDGKYSEAATQAEAVMQEGIYDVRLIGYFVYGAFIEHGVGSLTEIFTNLTTLLRDNWEAVGPVKNREKHAKNGFIWFIKLILKKVQYEQDKDSPIWQGWCDTVSCEEAQEAHEAAQGFLRALGPTLDDQAGPVIELLQKCNEWINSFAKIVYKEPEPEVEEEPEVEAEPATAAAAAPAAPSAGGMNIEGSYHLQLLLQRITAFESLCEQEKYMHAALVADEVNECIASFDPRIYFPLMFRSFSRLQAQHMGELSESAEMKDGPEWMAMRDFFKVDIDGFVDS